MPLHYPHSDYFDDRRSEYELCRDFPADEVLIDGLHAMQTHFMRRGMAIDIPVVRVMNTAHWLACYMFATTCSGDQMEYDVLSYNSMGRDKQLAVISLIVLIAMLKRTDGMRARNCRSVLLEDRSEDFYDGVSLYEQFLESGEARFAQEDFETDVMDEVVATLREQNAQLEAENKEKDKQIYQLEKTIKTMKQEYNQYNGPVYQGCTITNNNYYNQPSEGVKDERVSGLGGERVSGLGGERISGDANDILGIPHEGKYTEVRRYIDERIRFDEEFREFVENNSRVALCKRLSEEFGWTVDQYALGRNINRNRK